MLRRSSSLHSTPRTRGGGWRVVAMCLLLLSIISPLAFVGHRMSLQTAPWHEQVSPTYAAVKSAHNLFQDPRVARVLKEIEVLQPVKVTDMVRSGGDGDPTAVVPDATMPLDSPRESLASETVDHSADPQAAESDASSTEQESESGGPSAEQESVLQLVEEPAKNGTGGSGDVQPLINDPVVLARREARLLQQQRRVEELLAMKTDDEEESSETLTTTDVPVGKYNTWRRTEDGPDQMIRLMKDQMIMARAYALLAQQANNRELSRQLRGKIKECSRTLGEATMDKQLPSVATERVRSMGQLLARAREAHYDCTGMIKKLRGMVQIAEEQAKALKRQSAFLSQLAAKTVPKGLHCLSQRLTVEYSKLEFDQRDAFPHKERLEDGSLYHYALFSDNVLAAAVVVNSAVANAKEPHKHVFHLVTDGLNLGAFRAWFLANPPGEATIQVQSVDDFKWLNSSYCPVLKQLESESMKEFYFKADRPGQAGHNLKYRNPKYLSMLNHLRFYLPEVYPKLDKMLFLDDDIVVQKDLAALWEVDLKGNVNGAVETCGSSFHRFDKYLNFSNPIIAANFDPDACGWAYGMNVFDLKVWKEKDITGIYHKWQTLNEDRTLWKLGTLPPGLMTFYKLTQPLDKGWHVLGLGYNPNVEMEAISKAGVIHWNGNMKPWLDIGMSKFKPFWTRYVNYNSPYLQQCNITP